MLQGINIFSGEKGLGGALTNPTELSKRKGSISCSYGVVVEGKRYPDVEAAFMHLSGSLLSNDTEDELMSRLIAMKFQQHRLLFEEVKACGGVAWLELCSHWTKARTRAYSEWEGAGLESRFIRNLVRGYVLADSEETTVLRQFSLF